jgi:polysaccharide biosynthesis/export protein
MTINSTCIVRTLVLAGVTLVPAGLFAQTRTVPPPATAPRASSGATVPAPTGTAGTASTPAPAGAAASPAPARAASTTGRPWNNQDYTLGPGDKLRIEVYREPQLSQALQVRPDGKITLPLVGDVTAAGRTPIELRDSISGSLKEYVTNPVVTVIVQEAVAAQVYVIGEVSQAGTQVMQGPLTVLQALAQAGGLKEFAKKSDVHILRGTQKLPFNYKDAVNGRIPAMYLQPGDTIVVP